MHPVSSASASLVETDGSRLELMTKANLENARGRLKGRLYYFGSYQKIITRIQRIGTVSHSIFAVLHAPSTLVATHLTHPNRESGSPY